jgi:hypothetical protein
MQSYYVKRFEETQFELLLIPFTMSVVKVRGGSDILFSSYLSIILSGPILSGCIEGRSEEEKRHSERPNRQVRSFDCAQQKSHGGDAQNSKALSPIFGDPKANEWILNLTEARM